MGFQNHKDTWKIVQILEACSEISTQMRIAGFAKTSNWNIKPILKKLHTLGFIEKVNNKKGKHTEFNYASILWLITDSGKTFKYVIKRYVDA